MPKCKTRFYYFKDRYALLLLSLLAEQSISKRRLQQSSFSGLLNKDIVKEVLRRGHGRSMEAQAFEAIWPTDYECYFLSLGIWGSKRGGWYQTSRPGHNLVLQLNFSSAHDVPYAKLIDPNGQCPFSCFVHPIADQGTHTLAWSRMDIDLPSGEALIEEIQTDWIRDALAARRSALKSQSIDFFGVRMRSDHVIRYVDSILLQHQKIWDEAMLAATVWFLKKELGVQRIFYHTHQSGARIKDIQGRLPPRSVYSRLPKRFCFKPTLDRPNFLPNKARPARANPRYDNARFLKLDFSVGSHA